MRVNSFVLVFFCQKINEGCRVGITLAGGLENLLSITRYKRETRKSPLQHMGDSEVSAPG